MEIQKEEITGSAVEGNVREIAMLCESVEARERQLARARTRRREHLISESAEERRTHLSRRQAEERARHAAQSRPELGGWSVLLQKAQKKGRCDYQDTELKREQGVLPSLPDREDVLAATESQEPSSGDELWRQWKFAFTCCNFHSSIFYLSCSCDCCYFTKIFHHVHTCIII